MPPDLPALARRLRALTARRTGLAVCLWGEAGIGKTHAVRALLRETPCRSLSVSAALPLSALVELLPRPARLPMWAGRVFDQLQEGAASQLEGRADALGAVLAGLAPFVLHLEDIHEADAERLALLSALAKRLRHSRGAALLVTSRAAPPEAFEALRLEPLDEANSEALMQAEAGAALPAEALAWIHARAAGNPLFTLEYFKLLTRQGSLWNDGQQWRWREPQAAQMPPTVEALIEGKLQDVLDSPLLSEVAGALALLPTNADEALLRRITGCSEDTFLDARANLERQGVLYQGQFAHPLYREVTLERLSPLVRQRQAQRALQVLGRDPVQAAQWLGAAQLPPPEALRLLLRAAAQAQEGGQRASAAHFLARAAEYATGARRGELAYQAAQGLRDTDVPRALELARLALDAAPDDLEARQLLAELLAAQGELPAAQEVLARLPEAERKGAAGRLRQMRVLAAGRQHAALLELWRATPSDETLTPLRLLYSVAFALVMTGQGAEGLALAQRLLTRPDLDQRTSGDLLNAVGIAQFHAGDFREAAESYDRAIAQARSGRWPQLEAMFLCNRAMSLGELGRPQERQADLEASLHLSREHGPLNQMARTQVAVADAALDRADYTQAEELLLDSRDLLSRQGVSEHLIECEYRLSVLYRHWGAPHGPLLALKHARSAVGHARSLGNARSLGWSLAYAAIAEAQAGSPQRAQPLATEAQALAEPLRSPGLIGMTRFAQAFVLEAAGQTAGAQQAFAALEADLRAQGVEDAAQEVGLEADRLSGRADRAANRLTWFEERDMHNLVHLTRRYFPELAAVQAGRPLPAAQFRLDVLGNMQLSLSGTLIPVRGHQRRTLLACLLEARLRGRSDVARLELFDTLYPQISEGQANSALKELVHQTRAVLGTGVIQTTENGYALGGVNSDAETFLKTGELHLWRGPYLASVDLSDDLIRDTLYHALQERAEAVLEGDPAEAARCGKLLCEADPYDPAALSLTLRAHQAAGNHRTLNRIYEAARQHWEEVGESLPADWHAFLTAHPPPGSA